MKLKTSIITATLLAVALSMNVYADTGYNSDTDHDHVGSTSGEHTSGHQPMMSKMKAMQVEMQTIINTNDMAKRQAMFAAHKQKMKGMMKNMKGDCMQKHSMESKPLEHQGETD